MLSACMTFQCPSKAQLNENLNIFIHIQDGNRAKALNSNKRKLIQKCLAHGWNKPWSAPSEAVGIQMDLVTSLCTPTCLAKQVKY